MGDINTFTLHFAVLEVVHDGVALRDQLLLPELSSVPSGLVGIVRGGGSRARDATVAVINHLDFLIVEEVFAIYHHVLGMAGLGTKDDVTATGAIASAETAARISFTLLDPIVVPCD